MTSKRDSGAEARRRKVTAILNQLGNPNATFVVDDLEYGVWKVALGFWVVPKKSNNEWDWGSRRPVRIEELEALNRANK